MISTGGLPMIGWILLFAIATDEPPAWPPNRVPLQPRAKNDAEWIAAWRKSGSDETMFGPVPDVPAGLVPAIRPQRWRALPGAMSESEAMNVHLTSAKDREWLDSVASAKGGLDGDFGLAVAEIESEHDEVRFARLAGASLLLVNDEPFQGDPERRGYEGVPVALRKGANTIVVAGIEGGFELEFWKPQTRLVIATWDIWCPRTVQGAYDFASGGLDDTVNVQVFNASLETARSIHFHYGPVGVRSTFTPPLAHWNDNDHISPLAMFSKYGFALEIGGTAPSSEEGETWFPMAAFCEVDLDADRRIVPLTLRGSRAVARPSRPPAWPALRNAIGWHHLLVHGTSGNPKDANATLALARFWQQRCWYRWDPYALLVSDKQYMAHAGYPRGGPKHSPATLFGSATTNSAIASALGWFDSDPSTSREVSFIPDIGSWEGDSPSKLGMVHWTDAASMHLALAIDPFGDESIAGTAITLRATANGIERTPQAPVAK
jgi:hypothetical protein